MAYIGAGITRFNTADDLTVTDDAEIGDNATVGGNLSVTGTTTLTDDLAVDTDTLFVDASANRVGIGTDSPNLGSSGSGLHIKGAATKDGIIKLDSSDSNTSGWVQFTENGTDQWRIAYDPSNNHLEFTESGVADRMILKDGGDLQFNSGYGSVATAYGCRAWVQFDGTGAITINGSGNVSSIDDQGSTGFYKVNFSTSLPDTNYSVGGMSNGVNGIRTADTNAAFVEIRTFDTSGSSVDASKTMAMVVR